MAGTSVVLRTTSTSKFLTTALYTIPSFVLCITDFAKMAGRLKAPFRGTFRGVVRQVQSLELTHTGSPKRVFKVQDPQGYFIQVCALDQNAESNMIKEAQDVVLYWAIGRGPIGTSAGMVYLMRDSIILSVGEQTEVCCLGEEIVVEGGGQ